jgi:hypothetical protein
MKRLLSVQLLILIICAALPSISLALTGKVVSIADGDTITILTGKTQHKIRLGHNMLQLFWMPLPSLEPFFDMFSIFERGRRLFSPMTLIIAV